VFLDKIKDACLAGHAEGDGQHADVAFDATLSVKIEWPQADGAGADRAIGS